MTASPSPFGSAAPELIKLGYHPLPLLPAAHDSDGRGKAPGVYRSGHWAHMTEWQRFRDRKPTPFEMRVWEQNWPAANAGLVMGSPAGPGLAYKLLAADIDTTDPEAFDAIHRALPHSPMTKKGAKGLTLFYAGDPDIKSRGYKIGGKTALDVLTGNQTRQTVVPPSVHPDGPTYVWQSGPVPAAELPPFTADDLAVLEETLESLGWGREATASAPERVAREPGDDETIWRELNAEALANMAAWVPDLDLYGLKSVRRGGYEAVATWRASNSGTPTAERKANLKIHPDGIRDMGGDRGYSPLDLVQEARGCDLDAAFAWLTEKVRPRAEMIVLQVSSKTPSPPAKPIVTPEAAELPDHLTRCPGLVGEITDWITDSARRPQRGLALGAALCLVGTAAGRKFAGPTRTGTHLYVLALARTSAGKDHPLAQISRILTASGMANALGPSQFMSMTAVMKRFSRDPLALCPMDEFGSFLKRINSRRASGHEQQITGALRSLWGASFQTVPPIEWATQTSPPIHSPAVSIYGASTPEEFYLAVEGGDILNGFLNRFLTISTLVRPPEQDPTADPFVVPEAISAGLRAIHGHGGALLGATIHNGEVTAPLVTVPWAGDDVRAAYVAMGRATESRDADAAFLARTVEMAQRLAVVRAIGRAGADAALTLEDMEWGRDVALWSAERMMLDARDHIADTDHQGNANQVRRLIKARGRIKHSDLVRAMQHRLKATDLKGLLGGLAEAEEIVIEVERPAGGGTDTRWYRAI